MPMGGVTSSGRPERRPAGRPARRPSRGINLANIDPFCWLAVGPLLLLGVLGVSSGFVPLTVVAVLLAIVVLAGDAWFNRSDT